jgi:hypothetical protein
MMPLHCGRIRSEPWPLGFEAKYRGKGILVEAPTAVS